MAPSWKRFEQWLGKQLQAVVGVIDEGDLAKLVSSTGRLGQYYDLQIDVAAGKGKKGVAGEAKRRSLPKWFVDGIFSIVKSAAETNRTPLLAFTFNNEVKQRVVKTNQGVSVKVPRTWIAVPSDVFLKLLHIQAQHTDAELDALDTAFDLLFTEE